MRIAKQAAADAEFNLATAGMIADVPSSGVAALQPGLARFSTAMHRLPVARARPEGDSQGLLILCSKAGNMWSHPLLSRQAQAAGRCGGGIHRRRDAQRVVPVAGAAPQLRRHRILNAEYLDVLQPDAGDAADDRPVAELPESSGGAEHGQSYVRQEGDAAVAEPDESCLSQASLACTQLISAQERE